MCIDKRACNITWCVVFRENGNALEEGGADIQVSAIAGG